MKKREPVKLKAPISFDRFILLKGWSEGAGMFFMLLAIGLILSRLVGGTVAEHFSYYSAFWVAFAVKLAGVLLFYLYFQVIIYEVPLLSKLKNSSVT